MGDRELVNSREEFAELSVKGEFRKFAAISIEGNCVIILGKWLRIATIKDEEWLPGDVVGNPEHILAGLQKDRRGADIYKFSQKLPSIQPKYAYHLEWTNVAAIPTTSFADWWENRLPQVTRKNVRRAGRRGVVVKGVDFDDTLIEGIVKLNNSSAFRQRHRFVHYGKSFDAVKKDYSDFMDRSEYLGAYFQGELIGIIRLIHMGEITSILQLLCMQKHSDKRPANALIARAVELCAERGIRYLLYGQYTYGVNTKAPLSEFKRRNGFEKFLLPSYYVPLSIKGRLAIRLKLHMGIKNALPKPVMKIAYGVRRKILDLRKEEPLGGDAE